MNAQTYLNCYHQDTVLDLGALGDPDTTEEDWQEMDVADSDELVVVQEILDTCFEEEGSLVLHPDRKSRCRLSGWSTGRTAQSILGKIHKNP